MLFAVLVAVSSVLLGAALSFVPGTSRALLGYMRTFATLAAVAVVVTHLLPEALRELGPLSILLFLAGWYAPTLAHLVGQRSTAGRPAHAVLEAGYWGLVAHHVADGIGLGTYSRLPAESGGHLDVIVALAAHTVPLIAVVALAYRSTFGARSAMLRSAGLALASVVGIALSSLVAAKTIEGFAPIIAAVAAGLLLHVVTHDLTEDRPLTPLARGIDLVVAALGVAVSLLGVERGADPTTWEFSRRLVVLANRTSLVILADVLFVALVRRVRERGVRSSSFGTADPSLLGFFLLGFGAGAVRGVLTALRGVLVKDSPDAESEGSRGGWRAHLSEAVAHLGPWLVLGFLIGGLLESVPPSAWVVRFAGTLRELLLIAVLVNVTPVAAPAALLIVPGLEALGLSSGALLLFVTLGPLLAAPVDSPRLTLQRRVSVSVLCVVVAVLWHHFGSKVAPLDGGSPFTKSSLPTLALAALLLFGVWQRGARIWLSSIVKTPAHEHEHAHDVHGPHQH